MVHLLAVLSLKLCIFFGLKFFIAAGKLKVPRASCQLGGLFTNL
jgi:hypothetical protein